MGRAILQRVIAIVLVALVVAAPNDARQQPSHPPRADGWQEWSAVWSAVEQFQGTEGQSSGPIRKLTVGLADPLRSAMLDALLAPKENLGAELDLEFLKLALVHELKQLKRGAVWPLTNRESWLLASVLNPGAYRSRALVEAMLRTHQDLSRDQLNRVYLAGVEAAEDLRLDEALTLQRPLHERAQQEWSAVNLSMTLRRRGHYKRADAVLGEQIRLSSTADLLAQRGLNALASGNEARSRTYFGAALTKGSKNAAVNLARLDLAAGRLEAARSGFRAVFIDSPDSAWALRGWGIAQLEPLPSSSREQ